MLTHGSLFTGIGGFDLAAHWAGIPTLWNCEINEFNRKVLAKNFPDAIQYADIRDLRKPPHVGIVSGGFPCQPFSSAGDRLGEEDERYLWPEMLRVIREVRPRYVVGENVVGITNLERGKTLRRAEADLEAEGYKVELFDLPAYSAGLQTVERHIWIVATSSGIRFKGSETFPDPNHGAERQLQGTNQREYRRWDISETRFSGVSERVSNKLDKHQRERVKALGAAIPPQQAYYLFECIKEFDKQVTI